MLTELTLNFALKAVNVFMCILVCWCQGDDLSGKEISYISAVVTDIENGWIY